MKLKTSLFFLLIITLVFSSCRKEETEFIETPEDEILEANSNIADLIERTTSNDGSQDNIVDRANCFDIAFPYLVNVNGVQITVNSEDDYAVIECVFDASDSDTDILNINFPITIILADFSEVIISSISEFNDITNNCNGENEADNDIECIDFQYPIEAPIFNPNNELLETVTLENDHQFFDFIQNIDENNIVSIDFPITVYLTDNSEVSISNFVQLETAIENAINSCDEDDDYDYSDDDCDDCTITDIEDLLINCSDWNVNRLKRNATDFDSAYEGYNFNFFNDGTMSVFWNTTTVFGTWTASGSGNNLEIIIDVPALPLCNNNWILQEIKNCSDDTEINLIVGNDDRLQYNNGCN
ncbi:hypothetical protein [uncultured Winogradskyella sp.]|uniref:hypothetical protein n=1 Tax=uncultured Winogradskyella sp. TaxID=395353 RepID=UPI00261D4C51|nr:hypothetical protein [uncultured Winogradskyella sp.]